SISQKFFHGLELDWFVNSCTINKLYLGKAMMLCCGAMQ
ncbi:unnamed protein product, partial [Heterotrigona itama]